MKPTKIHPDTIIQPNRVTMMRYAIKPLEENLMTLVMDCFRAELYNGKMMDRNLWGEPVLNLNLKDISPKQKPSDTYKALKDLKRREFGYTYISPKNNKEVEVDGVLFPTVLRSGEFVQVKINTDALPFLLWLGESGGEATYFNKVTALALSGGHSKRLYKMLCSWKKSGGWRIKVDEFKSMIDVRHGLRDLKRFVLEPAKEELYSNQNSDIWFEYSTETSKELKMQGGRGRKPHDQIVFKIHTRYKSKNEQLEELRNGVSLEYFTTVFNFLIHCIGQITSMAQDITEACAIEGDRFINQRYKDAKKMWSEEKPKAFNWFMSSAQKKSENPIFKLRYKDVSEAPKKRQKEELENTRKATNLLEKAHQNIGKK